MVGELLDYLHTGRSSSLRKGARRNAKKGLEEDKDLHGRETRARPPLLHRPEALAPKGTVNFLNVRDDYYIVLPPDTDLTGSEGRRAFLRFLSTRSYWRTLRRCSRSAIGQSRFSRSYTERTRT
jgi:hypothetical protein